MTSAFYTAQDLRYDAEAHRSFLPDGTEVPHVTTVLSAVRVAADFERMAARSPHKAATLLRARERGTVVHMDCHAYDDGDLLWETVHRDVLPYVEAWATFREHKRLIPVVRERRLFHPVHHYTGTMDGLFMLPSGEHAVVDIKTGDPDSAAAHLQTAAYQDAYEASHPPSADGDSAARIGVRWSVWLRPERRVPYTVVPYGDHDDLRKFLCCLCVYNEQHERRVRR